MTHRQLLTAVWGPSHAGDTQYLRVYVGQIRQKLGATEDNPVILTEPGVGYRLAAPSDGRFPAKDWTPRSGRDH